MSNEADMDGSLARASTSLKVSTATDTTRSSRQTSVIGELLFRSKAMFVLAFSVGMLSAMQAEASNPTLQAIAPVAAQTVQLAQSQIDSLSSTCKILTNALDDLTKIHPFVSAAVLAFKTALQFEMTRRQNDKRIMLIQVKMNDMLSVLLILRPIAQGERASDGKTIEERLSGRITKIADDIEKYSAICDTFSKKKTVVKLFRSLEWEGKLEGFIKIFEDHRRALRDDLAIFSSVGIHQVNETLATVSLHVERTDNKASTLLLLQALRSPVDRELIREIELNGGADKVLKDENLMRKLIERSGDKDAQGDGKTSSKDVQASTLKEIIRDVNKSFADMAQENEELFSRKFKAQQEVLKEEMSTIARRESDRVIGAFTSGPHNRIIDKDLYEVWKESGWKGTTKARSLVLSLREYFAERHRANTQKERQALKDIHEIVASSGEPDSTKVQEIAQVTSRDILPEDEWALEYITISRIQPLLEAFDDDASSLVSVSEVNAFSNARPKDWSLAKWMAYWAAGFPLTLSYYFRRIQLLLARIAIMVQEVRKSSPGNNIIIDYFQNDIWPTYCLDRILAGAYNGLELTELDDHLFDRFRDYSVIYSVDALDTLQFVVGSARLEKNLFPLIYLLLHRVWHVLRHARKVSLHPQELVNIVGSLGKIYGAACTRAEHLTAMCKLQNLDPKEQLRKFSYGIYYYCKYADDTEVSNSSEYLSAIYFQSKSKAEGRFLTVYNLWFLYRHFKVCNITYTDLDIVKEDEPPEPLLYPEQDLDPHVEIYDEGEVQYTPISDGHSAVWSGHTSTKQFDGTFTGRFSVGVLYLTLPADGGGGDGVVTGSGMDGTGDFTVTGKLQGSAISFNKERASGIQRYSGTLSVECDEIVGIFGTLNDFGNFDTVLEDSAVLGRFELHVAPIRFSYLEPSQEALAANRARALWRFAIDSILNVVRIKAGHFKWSYLKDRRRIRQRFIKLYGRLDANAFPGLPSYQTALSADESEELASLAALCSKQDLQLYRKLSLIIRRRQAVHWGLYCDACSSDIVSARYSCLDCLHIDTETGKLMEILSDTIDLCPSCALEPATRQSDKKSHLPSHAIYQLRNPTSRREEWDLALQARELVVSSRATGLPTLWSLLATLPLMDSIIIADEKAEPTTYNCHYCREALQAPFWHCIDCAGNAYICMKCKVEKEDALAQEDELSFAAYAFAMAASRSNAANSGDAQSSAANNTGEDREDDPAQPPLNDAEGAGSSNLAAVNGEAAEESEATPAEDTSASKEEGAASDIEAGGGDAADRPKRGSGDESGSAGLAVHSFKHNLLLYQRASKELAETTSNGSVKETLLKLQERFSSFDNRLERLEALLDNL
ncbi:uncharacterized protein PHACADRAFT_188983, partial [Phanerochaete carnosa HHB-10118-sp]